MGELRHKWIDNPDGTVTISTYQDVEGRLDANAEARDEHGRYRHIHRPEHNALGLKVGSIPMVVVQLWKDQGFDVLSPERSGMTQEEHQREILRRLTGDWANLGTSSYGRLV